MDVGWSECEFGDRMGVCRYDLSKSLLIAFKLRYKFNEIIFKTRDELG
jgi:hypothetical protein